MNTESHHKGHDAGQAPQHADVSFEERDIKAGTIYGYLFALGLAVVASLLFAPKHGILKRRTRAEGAA